MTEQLNPEELQTPQLATLPVEDVEEKITEDTEELSKDEPTEEELKAEYIKQLKASRIKFRPIKNATKTTSEHRVTSKFGHVRTERTTEVLTNETVNQFDKKYKQKRKKKNKAAKASRRNNR